MHTVLYVIKATTLRKSAALLQQKLSVGRLPFLEGMMFFIDIYVHIYRSFRGKQDYTCTFKG
jgi:hypothetical protein